VFGNMESENENLLSTVKPINQKFSKKSNLNDQVKLQIKKILVKIHLLPQNKRPNPKPKATI